MHNLDLMTLMVEKAFNPVPDDKILDWSKLKRIPDDIRNGK